MNIKLDILHQNFIAWPNYETKLIMEIFPNQKSGIDA